MDSATNHKLCHALGLTTQCSFWNRFSVIPRVVLGFTMLLRLNPCHPSDHGACLGYPFFLTNVITHHVATLKTLKASHLSSTRRRNRTEKLETSGRCRKRGSHYRCARKTCTVAPLFGQKFVLEDALLSPTPDLARSQHASAVRVLEHHTFRASIPSC
jgi:hypothetical protein